MRVIVDQNGLSPESDVGFGYSELKSLSFAPQTGILGESASINEFVAEIVTQDEISTGNYCRLRDDMENLWAEYWVMSAHRIDKQTVQITARSDLLLLDRPTMQATFYNGVTVAALVEEIFASIGYNSASSYYTLDSSLASITLTGFCPEQTARDRLQWVCFAAGAYIKSYFCSHIQILPVPMAGNTSTLIPIDKTFYKPSIVESDLVTAVTVKAYSFTQTEPQTGDSYVTDSNGVNYVYTVEEITINNPEVQDAQFPSNVVSAQDVMLMDSTQASLVASLLSQYYFARTSVELDVIDNGGDYQPGQKVTVYAGEDTLYTGYIQSCVFRFGVQARASLVVAAAAQNEISTLRIISRYDGQEIATKTYTFPVGYQYSIKNAYLDLVWNGVRRVYRPLTEQTQGTMSSTNTTVYVDYDIALELKDGILHIISVDSVDLDVDDESYVAVIG